MGDAFQRIADFGHKRGKVNGVIADAAKRIGGFGIRPQEDAQRLGSHDDGGMRLDKGLDGQGEQRVVEA